MIQPTRNSRAMKVIDRVFQSVEFAHRGNILSSLQLYDR